MISELYFEGLPSGARQIDHRRGHIVDIQWTMNFIDFLPMEIMYIPGWI